MLHQRPQLPVIDTSAGIPLLEVDGHVHTEENGHDHGDEMHNEHIWTSPSAYRRQVENLRDGLCTVDPEHAEGYPAGELKHGPLALVDAEMPVVTVAPNDELLEKLKGNMEEVRARKGELFVFSDQGCNIQPSEGMHVIQLPENYAVLSPILHVIPLQLLAYHTAIAKGTDVDKPRNLAKSVTTE